MNLNERASWEIVLEQNLGKPESFPEDQQLMLIMALALNMSPRPLLDSPVKLEKQQCIFDKSVEDSTRQSDLVVWKLIFPNATL